MHTPIAITAMSGVFPGTSGPVGIDGYWQNVLAARPARLQSMERKWGIPRDSYFDPKPGTPYKTYLDASYAVSEATASPQIDLGRQVIADLFGSVAHMQLPDKRRTGLCVACLWTDPWYFQADARQVLTGTRPGGSERHPCDPGEQIAAVAEAVGLGGPSLAIDTACASSLYAIDAAVGFLRTGRADAVAVLGLNAFLPMFLYLGFAKLTALSPKSEILPFSADASGIIPSESVAALLVEPLDQAVSAGREVLAVIEGLGLSADGGDRSVFAPSPAGQQLAYERAYRGIDPGSVDYIEAHGTATVLGDQTEIETLDAYFGAGREPGTLPIGSAKALIGHTLASAGMVSVIKAICMMREGVVPPHIRVRPHPRLAGSCLRLPESAEAWPHSRRERRVGISSFGLGGANAHLVLGLPAAKERSTTVPSAPAFSPMAILAVEATAGPAHGLAAVERMVSNGAPQTRRFPSQRFSSQPCERPEGVFFPDQVLTESDGLRMGPRQLARLDPFQRLAIDGAQRLLSVHTGDCEKTAAVFCTNLGGDAGLQLARHYEAHFTGTPGTTEPWAMREPSLEGIASSLASLASGFLAFHLGLKGFHQLLSGDSSTFWNALRLAPYWLNERCSRLLLAAGRHIGSPLDLANSGGKTEGEAFAAMLLARAEDAERAGESPIAIIRAVSSEPLLRQACARPVDRIEMVQLRPDAAEFADAQKLFGFLGEATGMEAMLKLLLTPGCGWRAVEFRSGNETAGWVVVEKLRELTPSELTFRSPLPAEFQPAAPAAVSDRAQPTEAFAHFTAWQRTTEAALVSFLQAQRKLSSMLPESGSQPPAVHSKRTAVIRDARCNDSHEATATLVVDEAHPYFFDHPLDHVPGILLVEGIVQTVGMLMQPGESLRSMELKFTRFCEKDKPTTFRATRTAPDRYCVTVLQDGSEAGCCVAGTARSRATARAHAPLAARKPADYKLLHKHRPENVMVVDIQAVEPGQLYCCELLPPPSDHVLAEGDDESYSMLYLLETTRQFLMLVAHTVENIPVGMPMNLIGIQLRLDEPAPRNAPLRYVCKRQPVQRLGHMTIANVAFELYAGERKIGETTIKAQVVDPETYRKQRHFRAETGGRA